MLWGCTETLQCLELNANVSILINTQDDSCESWISVQNFVSMRLWHTLQYMWKLILKQTCELRKVVRINLEGTNICTKCHGKPSITCWGVSPKHKKSAGVTQGSPKSFGFILWGPWIVIFIIPLLTRVVDCIIVIYKLAWLIKNIITCGSLFNKVTSVIDCNMNGVFGHLRRNICSHYIITASDCTLWRTNSLSRRNSLKVDLVQHWIKSVMTVIWRQKSRNKIVLSCK